MLGAVAGGPEIRSCPRGSPLWALFLARYFVSETARWLDAMVQGGRDLVVCDVPDAPLSGSTIQSIARHLSLSLPLVVHYVGTRPVLISPCR